MGQPVVLLVHYDPRQVRALQGALESNGFTVHTCTDGEAALRTFPELHPDVVVVEAMIPRRNGFEVCRDLKATEAGRQTPIVITSGVFRSVRHRTEALHTYGCQEFLGRGFSPADLVTAVRGVLPGAFVKGPGASVTGKSVAPTLAPSGEEWGPSGESDSIGFSDILAELSEESARSYAEPFPGAHASLLPEGTPLDPSQSIEVLEEREISSWLDTLFPTQDSGNLAEQLQQHAATAAALAELQADAAAPDPPVSLETLAGMEAETTVPPAEAIEREIEDQSSRLELDRTLLQEKEPSRIRRRAARSTSQAPVPAKPAASEPPPAVLAETAAAASVEPMEKPPSPHEEVYGTESADLSVPPMDETAEGSDEGSLVPNLDPRSVLDFAPPPVPEVHSIHLAAAAPASAARLRSTAAPTPDTQPAPTAAPLKRHRTALPLSFVTIAVALVACGGWFLLRNPIPPGALGKVSRGTSHQPREHNASAGGSLAYLGGENPQSNSLGTDREAAPSSAESRPPSFSAAAAPLPTPPSSVTAPSGSPVPAWSRTGPPPVSSGDTRRDAIRPGAATPLPRRSGGALPLAIVEADGKTVLSPKPAKTASASGRRDGSAGALPARSQDFPAIAAHPAAPAAAETPTHPVVTTGSADSAPEMETPLSPPTPEEPASSGNLAPAPSIPSAAESEASPSPEPPVAPVLAVPLAQIDSQPVAVLRRPPTYPAGARVLGIGGEVRMEVLVLESGEVGAVNVLRSPSPILSQAASAAARSWRYRPATSGGRAVRTWLTESITFDPK